MAGIEEVMEKYVDPQEAWRSKSGREVIGQAYYDWIARLKDWTSFSTFTLSEPREPDVAVKYLTRLIQVLNKSLYGDHYTKLVGHSYFNYVYGMEKQTRDVVHFHMLSDKPIDYALIHRWWGFAMGFAYIKKIESIEDCVQYVVKYVMKSGSDSLSLFLEANPKGKLPLVVPSWWFTYGKKEDVKGAGCALVKPLTSSHDV
jgi:hypothetical protein